MKTQTLKRPLALFGAVVVLASLVVQAIPPQIVHAGQITSRSLTLMAGSTDTDSNGINDGGSMPDGVVNHRFVFTTPTVASPGYTIGSVKFTYCTTAAAVPGGIQCDAPAGLTTATSSLGSSSGAATFTGVTPGAVNEVVANVTPAIGGFEGGILSIQVNGVKNPSALNTTFFARITTHASTDGTGAIIDSGTVAASTADPIELSGTMPESLVFCTGRTISETNNVPDCTTATAATIGFNQLFSPQSTSWATSQMAASTNAGSGYAITVNGPTLMSGTNQINAETDAGGDVTKPGISQFGLNTALNDQPNGTNITDPDFNANPVVTPASAAVTSPTGGTLYNGQSVAPYNVGGDHLTAKYRFVTNEVVASSALASDPQVFTSTYMVNVPGSQPAGTYSTTLTYICTPTF